MIKEVLMKFNELKEETQRAFRCWCASPTTPKAFEDLVYCLIVNEDKIGDNTWEELIEEYKSKCLASSTTTDPSEKFSFNGCIDDEYIINHFQKYEIMREFYNFLKL